MRILVISDSHGNYVQAFKAHQLAGQVDHIVHLGDGAEDARLLEEVLEVPVLRVAGNCDRESALPQERLLELGGTRLLISHGHRYLVKSGLALLHQRALEVGAAVALYGHTHLAGIEEYCGVLLINPGQLKSAPGSCALLSLENGQISAEIVAVI